MSIKSLLLPETQNQEWSNIYSNSVAVNELATTTATITGDCTIGANNFNVIGGAGVDGQVLTTNGLGSTSWVTTGPSGDVVGPPAPVTDGAIPTFNGTTGKLLQDSAITFAALAVQHSAVTFTELKIDPDGAFNDYSFPQDRGTNGQVMMSDGAGLVEWKDESTIGKQSYVLGFGGNITTVPLLLNAWGDAAGVVSNVSGPENRLVAPKSGNITTVTWSSLSADGTTQVNVLKNGSIAAGLLLSGSEGLLSLSVPWTAGEVLQLHCTLGTPCDEATFSVYFEAL